jgi:transcriptional regulator with XRE-family HTH domain
MKRILRVTKLKKRRIELGLSQEVLGARVGLAISSIGGYERGENPVPYERALKLCEALGLEMGDLFRPCKKTKNWLTK